MHAKPLPPNPFKRALAAGRRQVGLWLTLDSPTATEVVAGAGYDWLLLDTEHTCIEAAQVVQHLRCARGGTAEMVVRMPSLDPEPLKRLLDAGVRSLMFPQVHSADAAARAVAATRYPPAGIRGVGGTMRSNDYSRIPSYFERAHEEICVIVQLESQAALDSIEAIAALEGIDGLFIGPNDLAASLGLLGQPGHPAVRDRISDALRRIKARGKAAGILNFAPAEARDQFRAGFDFIAVGSDTGCLARRSEALLAEIGDAAAPAPAATRAT